MAGSQIATSVTIINSLLGFQAISLSNMDSSAATVILAGSKVEIASAFFNFASNETPNAASWTAITTGQTAYLRLTPAGPAGSQTVTADWSSTAPVWSGSKQAWYLTEGSTIRYVASVVKNGAAIYEEKAIMHSIERENVTVVYEEDGGAITQRRMLTSIIELGDWNMDITGTLVVGANMTLANIMTVQATIINDASTKKTDFAGDGGGYIEFVATAKTNIVLQRTGAGLFVGGAYIATPFNRGYVTITHLEE